MCYSAMVEQSHARMAKRYHARVDLDAYEALFLSRRDGEKLIIPRGIEAEFTNNPRDKQEEGIAILIREWHSDQITRRKEELAKQTKRLADAEDRLRKRETKKALDDKRIAPKKISSLEKKIRWHQLTRATEADYRIFPQHYVSLVYSDADGNLMVGPFRYHLRPAGADETWDKERDGSYNARRESLETIWRNQFGSKHGLMLVKRFWENVSPGKYRAKSKLTAAQNASRNMVIQFAPDDGEWMEVPTIYDVWERSGKMMLQSTAAATDKPLKEVAETGHDRTLISLIHSAANQWVHPATMDKKALFALLDQIKRPYYEHLIAA